MKKFYVMFLIALVLGCMHGVKKESGNDFQGLWTGQIIDENDSSDVTLSLFSDDGKLTGKFTILNPPMLDEAVVFEISNIEVIGNEINLMVLTSGVLDEDAFQIRARLEHGQLVGTIQENRQGSEAIPFVFHREQ